MRLKPCPAFSDQIWLEFNTAAVSKFWPNFVGFNSNLPPNTPPHPPPLLSSCVHTNEFEDTFLGTKDKSITLKAKCILSSDYTETFLWGKDK